MTNDSNENKYKFLCEYQKLQFEDEKSQYFKLEDKSSKYLSFLNLFIPLYSFCFSYFFKRYSRKLLANDCITLFYLYSINFNLHYCMVIYF